MDEEEAVLTGRTSAEDGYAGHFHAVEQTVECVLASVVEHHARGSFVGKIVDDSGHSVVDVFVVVERL